MKPVSHWIRALVAVALLLPALANYHRVQAAPPAQDETTAIANAESAAPAVIAKEATIMDWDEDGMPTVVLREGTNGWTCLTDWPVSPGNDPACYDAVFNAWNDAMMAGEEPSLTGPGIAYMLAGGSDPSNTDPFAMEPAAGEDWISTPPHIMIVTSGGFDAADYATEPKQDEPYIMWDGTPYEHLMVPVVPMAVADMGDADADLQNTMSSAPAGIIHKATIKGNPETEGGDMVVLQEGESGWVCYPDRLVSPGNDPSCNDSVWEELFATPEPPEVTRTGVSYMLAGGSDESNTDPMATGPAPGAEWITTPRHIMLLTPGGYDADIFTTDHGSGYPYIMWDGTPYEHLMIPVADMPAMDMDGAPAHAATDDEALRDEIMTAEFTTWDHLIAHDVEATRAEIAEDFIMITADGDRLGREDLLAIVGDMAMTFEEPARDNVVVWRLGPDTAMIVYGIEYDGSYNGDAFAGNEETASIWQMREGRWQNIFLQSTRRAHAEAMATPATDDAAARIANAESAAPAIVAKDASILGYDADGMPTVPLREGTNGWTCIEDWPASPGNDPQCLDEVFTAWNDAFLAGEEPKISDPGVAFMLQGGSDPSNTDPFAMEPAAGEDWISTPSHVMLLSPKGFSADKYLTEPSQEKPYIMWDGTPYEHLMQPVLPMTEAVQIPTLDDPAAQEVLLAEQELNYAADFLHDADTADRMLADEYQEASTGSNPVKEDKLAWIKSGIYIGQQAEFSDVNVEFDGDTATITFTARFTGIYDGDPYVGEPSPVKNVWVKRDGQWQMLKGG